MLINKVKRRPVQTFVWVDSWQQQCIGDEFRVGADVSWDVTAVRDGDDWVASLLGPEWAELVRYAEDHHGVGDGGARKLRGVVRSIREVTSRLTQQGGSPPHGFHGGVWVQIPGSGQLREVDVADPLDARTAGRGSN